MSYKLTNSEDLYNFSSDCEEACCTCPQYRPWNPIDFDEDRNSVSPFEVFMYWKSGVGGDILFLHGYCANLTKKAKDTFRLHVLRQNFDDRGKEIEADVIDLLTGGLLPKTEIQILVFCKD
jgi:hypothetical protein